MYRTFCLLTLIILSFNSDLFAQTSSYETSKIADNPPEIDGRIDDPAWSTGQWAGGFTIYQPNNGDKPSMRTEFNILYDEQYIYIGFKSYDPNPDKIERRVTRRDILEGDFVVVEFDSYNDKRTGFNFRVSASGVKSDIIDTEDGSNFDDSWDAIWDAKAGTFEGGWSAEMRIPFTQLRFDDRTDQIWGFQVARHIYRTHEHAIWQPISREAIGWPSNFAILTGIKNIKPERRVEITPYSVGKISRSEKETGNPFADGQNHSILGGFDAKIGVTNNLNLDLSVNPDFGQVEADPSVVNLSAFETFFPEKRQFFVEGSNIFRYVLSEGVGPFGNDKLFHSRRIGRTPSHTPDTEDDEFASVPDNTSILAAMKLSGKTKKGYSIGILESVTQNETADFFSSNGFSEIDAEPLTNYLVGRLQKDYDNGDMSIGGMLTAVNRKIRSNHLNDMNKAAYTGGFDFRKQWLNKTYTLDFKSVFSNIRGSKKAISEAQEASQRYFQRPDADHVEFDPEKTSLSGYGGNIAFIKGGQGHWRGSIRNTWRSPGLELNDVGFLYISDIIMPSVGFSYVGFQQGKFFNEYSISQSLWKSWNYGGDRLFMGSHTGIYMQLRNFWNFNLNFMTESEFLNTSSLRGGPSILYPRVSHIIGGFSSNEQKSFIIGMNGQYDFFNEGMEGSFALSLNATWKPNNSLSLALSPGFNLRNDDFQFVEDIDFDNETKYVLANVNQKTFSLTARINYSITPDMSIQYYGQPFFSAGSYNRFKYAADTRNHDYNQRFHLYSSDEMSYNNAYEIYEIDDNNDGQTDYSFDKPDFNYFRLNSNLVFRWEFSPGSTIFLVWTQDRSGSEDLGRFSFQNDMRGIFNYHPNNILLIKINRWFKM